MYHVKTRNFNCNALSGRVLSSLSALGVQGQLESDNDGKFYLATANHGRAWFVWLLFMALRPLSGGWTYIVRPGHELGAGYRYIY